MIRKTIVDYIGGIVMTRTEMDLFGQLLSHSADGSMGKMEEIFNLCDHISKFGLRDVVQYKIVKIALQNWVGPHIKGDPMNKARQQLKAAAEYYELQNDINKQKKELSNVDLFYY